MSARLRLASGVRWSGPVITGVVAAIVLVGVGVAGLVRVVSAVSSSPADPTIEDAFEPLLAKHDETAAMERKRFDGRSIWWPPTPPPTPPAKETPKTIVEERPPEKPKEPPPPPTYTGPKVLACIGGTVMFTTGTQISIGETADGVKVVATNPPWDVTLHHLKKDYTVSMLPDSNESKFFGTSLVGFGQSLPPGGDPLPGMNSASRSAATPTVSTPRGDDESSAPAVVKQPDGRTLPPENEGEEKPADASAAPPTRTPPPPPRADADGETPSAPAAEESTPPRSADAPPALTKDQIDGMDRDAVTKAMTAVTRARLNRNLDEATRTRLNQELTWLQARAKALPR